MLRSTAGAITSLGLVLLLIALVVVPAAPVLAATPTLDVSTACDGNDHVVYWTTTSTDPTSDGGTADGAVTVTESLDYFGSITETVIVGEYNAGNGYQMSGSFIGLDEVITAPVGGAWVKVTVEVDGFNRRHRPEFCRDVIVDPHRAMQARHHNHGGNDDHDTCDDRRGSRRILRARTRHCHLPDHRDGERPTMGRREW